MAIHFISPPGPVSSSVDHGLGTWYKIAVLPPSRLIRARFLLHLTSFLFVLTSGTVSLAAAEFLPFSAPEEAVRPLLRDGVMSLDLSVEPLGNEGGSAVDDPPPAHDHSAWYPRVDVDAWAEAFAESSLLGRSTPTNPTASNPTATNPPATNPTASNPTASAPSAGTPLNHQVQYFLDRFTRERRQVIDKWFGRAGRYLEMIRDTLRDHGLPEDLAFVAMIESGFNPVAVSRAGAKGLWQFMAGTARRYGLRVDQWVDERLDPEKSTLAAAAYLRDLYAQFGSWSLAQAAYNAGEMTVVRAIRSVGSKDFWALARSSSLKRETKDFVPQIHAATVIGQDPSRYGFDVGGHSPADVEFVSIPATTHLTAIAKASGVSTDTLRNLNPVLVKGVTPPGGAYRLRVPAGTSGAIQSALMPGKPVGMPSRSSARADTHAVRPGETVSGIAKRYGVSVGDLLRWNKLAASDLIRPGDRLVVADLRLSAAREGQPLAR
jgi:soluble lytic murein transglycosylase-like protein/LysM repeat protein